MAQDKTIAELDLLALADGFLDDDPARKSEVEAAIARDPQAASRVSDYRAQTSALRAAHAGVIVEPVPERLLDVVESAGRASDRPILRRAAAGLMIVSAGLGGWLIGYDGQDPAHRALLDESYRHYVLQGPDQSAAAGAGAAQERAISWVDNEMAIRLSAPDLTGEGFSLVDKRRVGDGGDQLVALDYRSGDGRTFSLFIAPRWTDSPGPIVDRERDGVALAYWHDGPIAASIATQLPSAEARSLAETVRRAMRDNATSPPVGIEPEFRSLPTQGHDVLADTVGTVPQSGATDPVLRGISSPVGSN